jgi:hypothetical protein
MSGGEGAAATTQRRLVARIGGINGKGHPEVPFAVPERLVAPAYCLGSVIKPILPRPPCCAAAMTSATRS